MHHLPPQITILLLKAVCSSSSTSARTFSRELATGGGEEGLFFTDSWKAIEGCFIFKGFQYSLSSGYCAFVWGFFLWMSCLKAGLRLFGREDKV